MIDKYHTNSTIIVPFCNGNCSSSEFCNKTINQCLPKKNDNSTYNAGEECANNNCFKVICMSVGWECNNDSDGDCSVNYFCNNEHKCQIKSNTVYSGSPGGGSGRGTRYVTQTQPVTANKTNKSVNKSTEKQNETKTDTTKDKTKVNEGKILKIIVENRDIIKAGEKFIVKVTDNEGNFVVNVTVNYGGVVKFTDFDGKVEFVALNEIVEL